jgi:Fur family peroxide stress response transcriptional regulator
MSAEMESIEHQLEDSIASLRTAGIRITPQRQAILKFLIAAESHPTADEIYQALSPDFPNISVATILICENCGKIVDFHYPQLDEVEQLAQHVTEFNVSHHRMEIYGVCKECQDKGYE